MGITKVINIKNDIKKGIKTMSKTTRIIAALGVVAGLGVAALPAFTYATETVTGDVEVDVEILPAIAMTISGNNDNGSSFTGATEYVAVVNPAGSPAAQGWFERSGEEAPYTYTASADTEVNGEKTYSLVLSTKEIPIPKEN